MHIVLRRTLNGNPLCSGISTRTIARSTYFTPFIDVSDDFLSAKLQHPKVYFEENPLPEPEDTYLSHDAEMEDVVTYMIKKGQEADAKYKSSETDADRRGRLIDDVMIIGMLLVGGGLGAWIVGGSYVPWSARWRSYCWFIVLPLIVGVHIVSLVPATPSCSPMPDGFWAVYITNGLLVFMGAVLYQVLVVRVSRRYRGIWRGRR